MRMLLPHRSLPLLFGHIAITSSLALATTPARSEVVDPVTPAGVYTSIAVDGQGRPHIAYYRTGSGDLCYAIKSNGVWTIDVVDTTGSVGTYCSIDLNGSGLPRIAYYDATNGNLKYASKSGSTWSRETVAVSNDVGKACSLALDNAGNPYISCIDETNDDLKLFRKSAGTWFTVTPDADALAGSSTSLVLDSSTIAHIAYKSSTGVRYVTGSGSTWTIQHVMDNANSRTHGDIVSLALDSQGDPHVAFTSWWFVPGFINTHEVTYATRPVNSWTTTVVKAGQNSLSSGSVALVLDPEDDPRIVYRYSGVSGFTIINEFREAELTGGNWDDGLLIDASGLGVGCGAAINSQDELKVSYFDDGLLNYYDSPRYVTVSFPNGGQQFGAFQDVDIAWSTSLSPIANVKLEYGPVGGARQTIVASTPSTGPYPWVVPVAFGSNFRIWVSDASDGSPIDSSNANFSLCEGLSLNGVFGTFSAPNDITAADFNEDGILDMVVCVSGASNGFDVLMGMGSSGVGNGNFNAPVHYAVSAASSARDAAPGDFNRDGILDLAVSVGGGVQMFLGNGTNGVGNGSFTAGSVAAGGSTTRGILVADFDEDGAPDAALVNGASNNISIFRGLGNGTLQAGVTFNVGTSPSRLLVGDFNEDGIWDLAVTNTSSDNVSILIGQGSGGKGNGAFAAAVNYAAGDGPLGIASGDFEEDGITDLVIADGTTGAVAVLRGNGSGGVGNGTFAAPTSYTFGSTARDVGVADMNGDGRADILATAGTGDGMAIFYGSGNIGVGDGGFDFALTVPGDDLANQMVIGDFEEDGRPDAMATFTNSSTVLLYASGCSPLSGTTALNTTAPDGGEYWVVGTNQMITWTRGAGVQAVDVEISRDSGANWQKIAVNQTGTSFNWTVTPPQTDDARMRIVDSAVSSRFDAGIDFTIADGPYLLTSPNGGETFRSFASRNIQWVTNTTGDVKLEYRIGSGPKTTITASTPNDGNFSWTVPNTGSSQVRVFVSNGAAVDSSDAFFSICQSLASGTLYPSTGTGIGMATGDFNEDGITDVAEGGCGVRIHLGLGSGGVGNGAFGPASVVPLVGCGTAVATGDFNDDGITDLVAIDGSGLSTLRGQGSGGTGNGSFVRTATYPFPSGPEGLAVADFNEDGIEDIAAALRLQDQVGILFGNGVSGVGTGTFAPVVLVSTGDGPMDVAVQDFNEDGIWDIATSNAVAANVSILIGLGAGSIGNGTFAAPVHYAGIGGSRFLALDMSNDGIVDLVGGSVTLLKGNGSGGVGNGTFAAAVSSVGLYPILGIMDIDHNTLPDLVGLGAGRLELMRNTSSTGTFESAGSLPSMGANPQFAIAGDFLEDQIIDLAGISHSEPALAVALAGGCVSEAVTITLAEPSPTTWNVGTNQTITWSKSFTNFLNIHGWDVEVSRDNGVNWETIARKINNLSFAWTVTGPPSTQVLLRVRDSFRSSVFDVTSQKITIPGSVSGAPAPEPIRNNEITAAPNPSSGPVSFGLVLATAADVRLDVYDVAGRLVHSQVTGILQPGHHELAWNGSTDRGNRAPAGIYWARASWNGFRAERRIVRLP